ncbi:MAG TPA: DUF1588 domain-containing protein, partial [Gammaproteobacteria bacterium]|nr:DUF1588 domain-containing protein [Gammaproteobacteria bacterium]
LLNADYTYLNGRLADHYGIPGIEGSNFRRIELGNAFEDRWGLLGKGAILAASAYPERTSPVKRGSWVMSDLIGVPPPPKPPNVPDLKAQPNDAAGNVHVPSMREQMEMHHKNPACASCHDMMEPFGFVMESFDAIGRERAKDEHGNVIDTKVTMYDGQKVDGPVQLRKWLLGYKDQFVTHFAEKLMTYAIGRGIEYYDEPIVRQVVRESAKHGYSMDSMILAVVESKPFRMNMKMGNEGLRELTQKLEGGTMAAARVPSGPRLAAAR